MDKDEVQDCKWVDIPTIYREIADQPQRYTSWLRAELKLLEQKLFQT